MSTRDRLAATLRHAVTTPGSNTSLAHDCVAVADTVLATDPTLAQDAEDGRALRELREALPERSHYRLNCFPSVPAVHIGVIETNRGFIAQGSGATIAEAADRARDALERRP